MNSSDTLDNFDENAFEFKMSGPCARLLSSYCAFDPQTIVSTQVIF